MRAFSVTVLNDVLDFSKMEAGKLAIELAPFSVRELLQEIEKSLDPAAREKGLRMVFDAGSEVRGQSLVMQYVFVKSW